MGTQKRMINSYRFVARFSVSHIFDLSFISPIFELFFISEYNIAKWQHCCRPTWDIADRTYQLVRSLSLRMEDDLVKNKRFQVWVTLARRRDKKPCVNLSVLASTRCVLLHSLPNNTSLKELYFQACVSAQ